MIAQLAPLLMYQQPALEESTHLSASNSRKTPSPQQRGTTSPALGAFHNTHPAATPAMGCWRVLKKIKDLHKDEASLGQLLLMAFLGKLLPLFYL